MKNLKYINSFVFNFAEYRVESVSGSKALLKVNYKDNTFSVAFADGVIDEGMKNEASKIARDLLGRKHGVNFANI